MPKSRDATILNGISDNIRSYKESLNDESMTPVERLLTLLLIDLNYFRWESFRLNDGKDWLVDTNEQP